MWHPIMFIKSDSEEKNRKTLWEDLEEALSHSVKQNIFSGAVVVLSPGEHKVPVCVESLLNVIIPPG